MSSANVEDIKKSKTQDSVKIQESRKDVTFESSPGELSDAPKGSQIMSTPSKGSQVITKKEVSPSAVKDLANVQQKYEEIEKREKSINEIKKDVSRLKKVADLDNKEQTLELLKEKRIYLKVRIESIENLTIDINNLEDKITNTTSKHNEELERLKAQRKALNDRKDLSSEEIEQMKMELDKKIAKKEVFHSTNIRNLQAKVSGLKNDKLESVRSLKNIDESAILEQIAGAEMSDKELEEFEKKLQLFGVEGWENFLQTIDLSAREKLELLLGNRNLVLTASGRIRTLSGTIYTIDECKNAGLLDGLEEEFMQLQGICVTSSDNVLTAAGRTYSLIEAKQLGLLKEADIDAVIDAQSCATETESVTTTSSSAATTATSMSTTDVHYLKSVLGMPLTLALSEITAKQPKDPIHYLAHWLFKYRYNQEVDLIKKAEIEALMEERQRLAILALRQRAEDEARATLIDLLGRVDTQIEQREMEAELRRIEEELRAREEEDEHLEDEARDTLGVYKGPTSRQKL